MINRALVVVMTLVAAGAGYASAEYLDNGPKPEKRRIRGGFRSGVVVAVPLPDPAALPVPDAPAKPGDAVKPAPAKPEPAKPAVPVAPAIPVRVRVVKDVKLTAVANAKDYVLKAAREVHVDEENTMTWFGDEGKTMQYKDMKHLETDLRGKSNPQLVIVPAPNVSWQHISLMITAAQNNYAPEIYLGVASKDAPETVRILPFTQCQRSDEPLPDGKLFRITLEKKDGPPQLSIDGKKLEAFPADLAAAWAAWSKANPDAADTSIPEKTRVVLDAPRGAAFSQVVQVIDALRGMGIQTERCSTAAPMRKLK